MIVVDSSALLEIALELPRADHCMQVLVDSGPLSISSGTVAEALIVARRRGVGLAVASLIRDLRMEIVAVTAGDAERVADAYDRWGKGVHPASLNLGDCFA